MQIVNEVPPSTTSPDKQAVETTAVETTPVQAAPTAAPEESKDDAEKEKEADTAGEKSSLLPTEGASEAAEAAAQASAANGPTLTVEAWGNGRLSLNLWTEEVHELEGNAYSDCL